MTTTISAEQIKFAHDAFIANYKSFPVALSGIIESPSRSPYSNAGCLPHRSPPQRPSSCRHPVDKISPPYAEKCLIKAIKLQPPSQSQPQPQSQSEPSVLFVLFISRHFIYRRGSFIERGRAASSALILYTTHVAS